jgi:hypothetical protein
LSLKIALSTFLERFGLQQFLELLELMEVLGQFYLQLGSE